MDIKIEFREPDKNQSITMHHQMKSNTHQTGAMVSLGVEQNNLIVLDLMFLELAG
jgi:hypothetical protein